MKNQYFGDINDYLKYGILRCLANKGLQIGVCWMLTHDDGRPDGRKTTYLTNPKRWREYDTELFDTLSVANERQERHVQYLEKCGILQQTRFFRDPVLDNEQGRELWFENVMKALDICDLIFFDPDNGIEVPSKPRGRKSSSKYVYWSELTSAWNRGASLLIFQHFARVNREEYITQLTKKMAEQISGSIIFSLRTSNVLYLLACHEKHRDRVEKALENLNSKWNKHKVIYNIAQHCSFIHNKNEIFNKIFDTTLRGK